MIKITTKITQNTLGFSCNVDATFVDEYDKTAAFQFSHNILDKRYDFDLSALCIAVMALDCVSPGHRNGVQLLTPSQLVVDIVNKKSIPDGIYKNYGNKLLRLLDMFQQYTIIKY